MEKRHEGRGRRQSCCSRVGEDRATPRGARAYKEEGVLGCRSAGLGSGIQREKGMTKLMSLLILPPVTIGVQVQAQEKGDMPHCQVSA